MSGISFTSSGVRHAFLYSNGTMQDLGMFGGTDSWACAINNSGQILGYIDETVGPVLPFLYSNGTTTNLGSLKATAINNAGQIVGGTEIGNLPVGFLLNNGTVTDIAPSGRNVHHRDRDQRRGRGDRR